MKRTTCNKNNKWNRNKLILLAIYWILWPSYLWKLRITPIDSKIKSKINMQDTIVMCLVSHLDGHQYHKYKQMLVGWGCHIILWCPYRNSCLQIQCSRILWWLCLWEGTILNSKGNIWDKLKDNKWGKHIKEFKGNICKHIKDILKDTLGNHNTILMDIGNDYFWICIYLFFAFHYPFSFFILS